MYRIFFSFARSCTKMRFLSRWTWFSNFYRSPRPRQGRRSSSPRGPTWWPKSSARCSRTYRSRNRKESRTPCPTGKILTRLTQRLNSQYSFLRSPENEFLLWKAILILELRNVQPGYLTILDKLTKINSKLDHSTANQHFDFLWE